MWEPKSTMHRPWSSYDFDSSTKLIALQMPHALKMAEWPIRDFDSTHSAMADTIQGTSLVATLLKLPAHWWMSLVDTLMSEGGLHRPGDCPADRCSPLALTKAPTVLSPCDTRSRTGP